MRQVLLLGAGKIGRMISRFLAETRDYEVTVADHDPVSLERLPDLPGITSTVLNASDRDRLTRLMKPADLVISALSFRFNPLIAEVAAGTSTSYFDLTEDVETTSRVRAIAENAGEGQIFMPQCGLAPGFISIIAQHLADRYDQIDSLRMRVGALPQFPTDALKYNLTRSTDGLINEYCNPCDAIYDEQRIDVLPLEGLEHFSIDGVRYEAFNTSGGLGTLCDTLAGKVRELNYKTIRYMGHRDLVSFLVNDLRLSQRRDVLKDILEHAVPVTFQDVVVTFCTVTGLRKGQLVQTSDARKIYSRQIGDEVWSAIQVTTAAGICAAVDLFCQGQLPQAGFVRQEEINCEVFMANRFGQYYQSAQDLHVQHDGFSEGE